MENGKEIQTEINNDTLFALITNGDASKLTQDQKLQYYRARCEAAGLDYRAQPFQFIKLNGKEVLYALKSCTDQLAGKHGIVCEILGQVTEHDIRTVTVRARSKDGKQTDEIGAVGVKGYVQDALANAYMKAVTKAKRRAILSLCGLGLLDETEVETIPGAQVVGPPPAAAPAPAFPPAAPPVAAAPPKDGVTNTVTVQKVTKSPEGFKVYDTKGGHAVLKDETMAKQVRLLTGKLVSFQIEMRDGTAHVLSYSGPGANG